MEPDEWWIPNKASPPPGIYFQLLQCLVFRGCTYYCYLPVDVGQWPLNLSHLDVTDEFCWFSRQANKNVQTKKGPIQLLSDHGHIVAAPASTQRCKSITLHPRCRGREVVDPESGWTLGPGWYRMTIYGNLWPFWPSMPPFKKPQMGLGRHIWTKQVRAIRCKTCTPCWCWGMLLDNLSTWFCLFNISNLLLYLLKLY